MEYTPPLRHITARLFICDGKILKDSRTLNIYAREAAKKLNLGRIQTSFFLYNPIGTTVVVLLNLCQLTISTSSYDGYAEVNLLILSHKADINSTFNYLKKVLKAHGCDIYEVLGDAPLNLASHLPTAYNKARTKSLDSKNIGPVISLLGSGGGVAKSLLSILNIASLDKEDPLNYFINSSKLNLVDIRQKPLSYYTEHFPNLKDKITLYEFDVNKVEDLKNHLKEANTSIVLDISYGDTVDMLRCCNSLGIAYINTALESVEVDENQYYSGFPLQERYKIFESHRDEFNNTSAIVCSGMNPGVVQWMAIELMNKYPDKKPIGCYIVENDTSFFENEELADKNTIYTTWFPMGFLDEAINSYPTFMKKHQSLFLYNEIYSLEFKVTLGNKEFYGALMPHEEAITLGKIFDMETGFIYKINDHTTGLIKSNISNTNSLWERPMKVLDPELSPLKGEDLVGILLVFEDMEAYIYNSLSNKEAFEKYRTNATYLQAASGVYAALATMVLDNIPQGIYYVDELLINTKNNYGKYISYHLNHFLTGENNHSDGDLLNRMKMAIK